MNVIRTYSSEGKTLQELMATLLPIYIQEKIGNQFQEELDIQTHQLKNREG